MKNNNLKIYTVGAITTYYKSGDFDTPKIWRQRIKEFARDYLTISIFDPTIVYPNLMHNLTYKSGVIQNEYFLKKSDIVICNLDKLEESPGSLFELITAKHCGIPVFAFGNSPWKSQEHINYCIGQLFDELEELLEDLNILYFQYFL